MQGASGQEVTSNTDINCCTTVVRSSPMHLANSLLALPLCMNLTLGHVTGIALTSFHEARFVPAFSISLIDDCTPSSWHIVWCVYLDECWRSIWTFEELYKPQSANRKHIGQTFSVLSMVSLDKELSSSTGSA